MNRQVKLSDIVAAENSRVLSGDLIDFGEVVDFGEVTITVDPEDMGTLMTGAPVRKAIQKVASAQKTNNLASPETMKAVAAAKRSAGAVGAPMPKANFPLILIENGTVHTTPTQNQVQGRFLQDACIRTMMYAPGKTLTKAATGAGLGAVTTIIFTGADLSTVGGTLQEVIAGVDAGLDEDGTPIVAAYLAATPLVMITITSSNLNAAPDQRLSLSIGAKGEFGVPLSTEQFVVSRKDGTKSTRIMLIPYTKVGDVVIPNPAFLGRIYDRVQNLLVKISGADSTMQITAEIPGRDSKELKSFLNSWGLNPLA